MSRVRDLAHSIALSLSLSLSAIAFQPGALAQTQGTYQAQISTFHSKLGSAQSTQVDLNRRVACLNQREAQLISQRKDKELALGRLRSREQELAQDLRTKQAAYDGFRGNFLSEQNKLADLRRQLNYLQAQHRAQEEWIKQCEREKHWTRLWGLACRADMDLAKTFGQIKNYERDIPPAAERERIARQSMEFSRTKLNDSERALTATRNQAGAIGTEITRTETAIVNVSSVLAAIRASVQPLRIVIDEFASALNEAKRVNPADQRPRALRKLAGIAADVDAAIERGRTAATHADGTLGAGWMKSCKAS